MLGVAASWFILPVRSRDVARQAIARLDLIAPAFNAHRRLHRSLPGSRRERRFFADTSDELRGSAVNTANELRAEFSRADRADSR